MSGYLEFDNDSNNGSEGFDDEVVPHAEMNSLTHESEPKLHCSAPQQYLGAGMRSAVSASALGVSFS